ncbi:lumazine synthase [Polyrhizophydium stewartii]|uniref:6,7-dimethyl-8-ribityllumazine synthase n=1 Tax=Polyrhizophydium stewartii TaxID=2732419 RepID=A0ABR4N1Y7_9FUNG
MRCARHAPPRPKELHTRWNAEIVARLVAGTTDTLASLGVAPGHIDVVDVPGAFELPFAAQQLLRAAAARGAPYAACVAIGVLIKGSTMHFEYISDAACHGLMDVGLRTGFPVILGVLTCLTEEQARERAGAGADPARSHNHGIDWAVSAVEMALLSQPTRA